MKQTVFIIGLVLLSFTSYCQKTDTLIYKLDSLSLKTDSAGGQKNNTRPVTGGSSPSFPSGHTSDAFTLAILLSLAFP